MAHNARTRNPWNDGDVPTSGELADLSRKAKGAINGVDGSTHAPTSLMLINGSGLDITGPTRILGEGSLQTGLTGRFQHEDADFPQLGVGHAGGIKRILSSGLKGVGVPLWNARPRLDFGGVQSNVLAILQSTGLGGIFVPPIHARVFIPLDVLDGAPFTSVTVNFRVGYPHDAVPVSMPRIAVVRVDHGGIATALTATAPGADASGYVPIAKPASGPAWYAGGAAQSVTIPIDAGVVIDEALYTYFVDVFDEQGPTSAPWVVGMKADVDYVLTAPSGGLSGLGLGPAGRVLVTAENVSTTNGIYDTQAGAWTPSSDCAVPGAFTPGFLVKLKVSAPPMNGALFQFLSPTPVVIGTTPLYFQSQSPDPVGTQTAIFPGAYVDAGFHGAFVPVGNIWTSVLACFAPTDVRY